MYENHAMNPPTTFRSFLGVALMWLLGTSAWAQSSVGLTVIQGRSGDGPVTVFYPSSSPTASVQQGPFKLELAQQGKPEKGNGRLVVISHGSGGSPWPQSDLAQRLVRAGFVVAMPEHQGDNWQDMSKIGPPSWQLRPLEVSRAIDAVLADPRFGPHLSPTQVGMHGMSAGGHTALVLAGGRWSEARLLEHCKAHLEDDFSACAGPFTRLRGGWLDGIKKGVAAMAIPWNLRSTEWHQHTDPRIRAIVSEVPFAADFDVTSLARPTVPLGLVRAARDIWLVPRFHIDPVRAACQNCELIVDQPDAGHGSLLSPPVPGLSGTVAELLADPPGYDRARVPLMHERIVQFMRDKLLP